VGFLELCGFLELLYVAAGEKKIWQRVGGLFASFE